MFETSDGRSLDLTAIKQQILQDVDPEIKEKLHKQTVKGYAIATVQFVTIIVVVLVMFYRIMGLSTVSGNSMFPTLHNKNVVVYQRNVKEYFVGDIVVVKRPDGEEFVKRIVALAGDTVTMLDGQVYVNGILQEMDGPEGATYVMNDEIANPYIVGADQVYVMGDNRAISNDSRSFGAVELVDVAGRMKWYLGLL